MADSPAFVDVVREQWEARAPGRTAVVGGQTYAELRQVFAGRAGESVVWVEPSDRSERHAFLAARGPFELVVDARGASARNRLRDLLPHVCAGGALVVRGPRGADPRQAQVREDLARQVELLECGTGQDEVALRSVCAGVTRVGPHVVVQSAGGAWAKMREPEMDRVIELRADERARILERRPAVSFESRCALQENRPGWNPRMHPRIDAPPASLREYADAICLPGQVAVQGNLLLPDTYRHNQQRRLQHRRTEEVAPRFARPCADLSGAESLAGTYFHLDSELRGHFGHTMTEQVSRLWALSAARSAYPDLKVLLAVRPKKDDISSAERTLLSAMGVEDTDVVALRRNPVRVERLLGATPMLSMPAYVHPDVTETWAALGRTLAGRSDQSETPRRIFCSRRTTKRRCRNGAEVEDVFRAHGFTVIFPEDYPLADQARIFREAEVVAGYAGSAMFNLCFAETPKPMVVVSSESYTATNEYLIASAVGHPMTMVWCPSDLPQPADGWSKEAFEADFAFDFARDGEFLTRTLQAL